MEEYKAINNLITENEIKYIDYRFTDLNGRWHHITYSINSGSIPDFRSGIRFDGSSISGWKSIEDSDMILMPVPETAFVDPFASYPTLIVICDVYDPVKDRGYDRDPRFTARLAEQYLLKTGIGDQAFFGPELEFFIFDDVRFRNDDNYSFYNVESEELPINSRTSYANGNHGHRPRNNKGYMPVPPVDSGYDIRLEMLNSLEEVGIETIMAHHEVAPCQHELGMKYSTLLKMADNIQKYKYVVNNTATSFGKTVTFMPKPIYNNSGNGMHVHQSLWKNGKNLFIGSDSNKNAGLSEIGLYYVGGIKKHLKALNAICNASTNSYKRLVPGFEAPIVAAYSARNRSGTIRIPHVENSEHMRIEARFPDPSANPYLCFSALLLAGLDGIKNKIYPGEEDNRNLYNLSKKELKTQEVVAKSLDEAIDFLDKDRDFLLVDNIFTNEQINAFIELREKEIDDLSTRPHPLEFEYYFSV